MKNSVFGLLLFVFFSFVFVNLNLAQSVIAKYGDKVITVDDFKAAYLKSQSKTKITKQDSTSVTDFLKLYVNFKMKLQDAEDRGFTTDESIQKEAGNYKKEIGVPYYVEKYIKRPAIKKLYEMSKYELRVSHILIKPDTISNEAAKKLAQSIIRKINNGADFGKLALKFSADKRSAVDGGDIYWLTAGQTIPEFEKAIYATEPGHVYPKPIKTKFGYHIIKVVAKQKRVPGIEVSHILIDFKDDNGKVDTAAALAKAKKIRAQLDAGADFGELALKYSEDKGSAPKKGFLGIVQRRMMVKPFDEAAFKLKVGETSGFVKSKFGFHIIRKTGEEKFPTFEQSKKRFSQIYEKRDFQQDLKNILEQLKAKTNYFVYDTVKKVIGKNKEPIAFGDSYWNSSLHEKLKNLPVCSINGEDVSSDEFFKSVQDIKHVNGFAVNNKIFDNAYKIFERNLLLYQEVKNLDKTDSTFKQLMADYRDGIYIFRLQDSEVWNKLKIDSTKLKPLYEKNMYKYQWKDRVSFIELFRYKEDSIKVFADSIKGTADFAKLAANKTKRSKKAVKDGFYNLVDVKSSEMAAKAYTMNEGDLSEPFKVGNGWAIIKVTEKSPAHQKSFEEALPEVSSLYQEETSKILENNYLDRLKSKYHPIIYSEKLKDVFEN